MDKVLYLAGVVGIVWFVLKHFDAESVRAGEAGSPLMTALSLESEVQEGFDFSSF